MVLVVVAAGLDVHRRGFGVRHDGLGEGELEAGVREMDVGKVEGLFLVPDEALDAGAGGPAELALALGDPEGAVGREGEAMIAGAERGAIVEWDDGALELAGDFFQ